MSNKISDNIRKLRQKKGMSQDRLSKEADLVLNTIVKIETGENPNPTVETLEKIAKILGVSVQIYLRIKIYGNNSQTYNWKLYGYGRDT